MKLKTLSLVAAVLAGASVATWLFSRRDSGAAADARVGRPMLAAEVVPKVAGVRLVTGGTTINLVNTDPANPSWVVREYHDLPVDFAKLTRLIADLREAKITRFLSADPVRIARMEFGDTTLELLEAGGATVWRAHLGKTPSGGGRFVKFDAEERAYLANLSTWIDSTVKNWADATLVDFKPEAVTALEVGFNDGPPLHLSRETPTAAWTAAGLAAGEKVRESTVSSLLSSLTGLRFTETFAPDAPDVVAAREHLRTLRLTATDGRTLTIALGRRPAPPAPPPPPPPAEGETAPPAPPAPQPGPVFAFVASSVAADAINTRMTARAFQIPEWTYTGLPADRAALIEAAPPPPPPGAEAPLTLNGPTSFPDEAAERAYLEATFADFQQGPRGLRYKLLQAGSGDVKPAAGVRVRAHYTGRLLDGSEFDSSIPRGEPFAFALGRGQVIAGWDETLADMTRGEKRLVVIPYQLGYGERGSGARIPARATLVFEIELVDWE